MRVVKYKRSNWTLELLAVEICRYFMKDVIPWLDSSMSHSDLEAGIASFCAFVEVRIRRPRAASIIRLLLVLAVLLSVTLWSVGALGVESPALLHVFFPYIGVPFSVLLAVYIALKCTRCGWRSLVGAKRFLKRWGLRILMLLLELLYIPILTNAVPLFFAKPTSCGAGSYLAYDRVGHGDALFDFVNHTAVCTVCAHIAISSCDAACSGVSELRLLDYPNLFLVDDVLEVCGGVLLSCFLGALIALPFLFFWVTHKNRRCIKNLFVYGETVDDKWAAIINRLDTTGIFFFSVYKYPTSDWGLSAFAVKFGVMVITTLAGRVWPTLIAVLPIWYLGYFILVARNMPFLFMLHNVLTLILYGLNTLFAVLPILAWRGIALPDKVLVPVGVALLVVPLIVVVVLLCCREPVFDSEDPTLARRKLRLGVKAPRAEGVDANFRTFRARKGKARRGIKPGASAAMGEGVTLLSPDEEQAPHGQIGPDDAGPDVVIRPGFLDPIAMLEAAEEHQATRNPEFVVGSRRIEYRATEMYKTLDVIIDGATIGLLASVLHWAMLFGALGVGWYLGGLRAVERGRMQIDCG
jgi:hypothetical protein